MHPSSVVARPLGIIEHREPQLPPGKRPGAVGKMIAHVSDTFAGLSVGQALGFAAYVATLMVVVVGVWELDT